MISGFVYQQQSVGGTFIDVQEVPVPGVHVLIQNLDERTFTDTDNAFTLGAFPADVLVLSYFNLKIVPERTNMDLIEVDLKVEPSVFSLKFTLG